MLDYFKKVPKKCQLGWYGNSCQDSCGHCVGGNTTCDKVSGSCPSCDGAFQPPLCKDTTSDKDKETVSLAGPMAGVAVGCSVAFFIIGLVTGFNELFKSGTSIPIPHHEEKPDISPSSNTSDYSNINVYEALKGGDDDTTSPYTSLSLPPTRG
ncbi:hypothetical protein C0Q70_15147 [Pomacea canaliculata]|uniref:Uncharacterized protein n=1 Tax=Pomacea canaliculata TaxID=400727 RepID=A0A2T7NU24_POMCA|nr:hypothetical protein C0Q70_15147 [Pomacea canaliculata]